MALNDLHEFSQLFRAGTISGAQTRNHRSYYLEVVLLSEIIKDLVVSD